MRRRILIFGAALALYAVLLSVAWTIGTNRAAKETDWQLDYAIIDLHDTLAGAIDTMLGHVARMAVRHIGSAAPLPIEEMEVGARELDIDEINVVSREGVIIASNDPSSLGVVMAGDPVMDPFMALTNGVTATVSQPFRANARNPEVRAKYLAAAFPGGDGFVQVGLDERRLSRMLPSILGYIFDEWLLGRTGFFLCADMATGRLVSNPSRHRDEARTLEDAGFRLEDTEAHEIVLDGTGAGRTFVETLFGEKCYCRSCVFAGHRFVAALPEREYYRTRNIYAIVYSILFFIVLLSFAFFIDRIFRYSDRIKAFYETEERRRSKELAIAKTIQTSALAISIPSNTSYEIDASMQAAKEIGGDFYDYFYLDATHVAFLVADVSGKGITAALYMMTAKTLIRDMLLAEKDPATAFTRVNSELARSNSANMFLTAWAGILDLETGAVTFANAGHNPPVVVAKGSGPEVLDDLSGPVLAFMDGISYRKGELTLRPGDLLFLYTDGVTEALDSRNELFGEERLINAIKVVKDPSPHMLSTVVRAAVAAFSEGVPQADDLTVLAIRYNSPPNMVTRSFPPSQEGVKAASDYIDEAMASVPGLLPKAHIILDEICSNIVRYSKATGFEVDIDLGGAPDEVKLIFIDDGVAYDPLTHLDPDTTLPAAERKIGGLGIMMVKSMAKSVSYRRGQDRNILLVTLAMKG